MRIPEKHLYRIAYYMIRSIILSPVSLFLLMYLRFKTPSTETHLASHLKWLMQGEGVSLGIFAFAYFADKILIFTVNHFFLSLSNDFITAMIGTGLVAITELWIIFMGFAWLHHRTKTGLVLLNQSEPFTYPSD